MVRKAFWRKCEWRAEGQVGLRKKRLVCLEQMQEPGQLGPEDHMTGFCIYSRGSRKWEVMKGLKGRVLLSDLCLERRQNSCGLVWRMG